MRFLIPVILLLFSCSMCNNYVNAQDNEREYSWGYKKELIKNVDRPKYAPDDIVDKVAIELEIDFEKVDRKEFARGMIVELEHGTENPATDVTGDDPVLIAKIVLAHLNRMPDYYTLLDKMEEEKIHKN